MPTIDWPPQSTRRRWRWLGVFALVAVGLGASKALSLYVESLWFTSLGFGDVFWTTLSQRARIFLGFAAITFLVVFLLARWLKPADLAELGRTTILVNGQPVTLPLEPVVRLASTAGAVVIGLLTGLAMSAEWERFALYWHGGLESLGAATEAGGMTDPIFGKPLVFYLFTLPVWRLIAGWLMTLAIISLGVAAVFSTLSGGAHAFGSPRRNSLQQGLSRGVCGAFAAVLATLGLRVYLGRFDRLFVDHTIFSGITYTDANVAVNGLLVVAIALGVGALIAAIGAVARPRTTTLVAAVAPAAACYLIVNAASWYVGNFVVRPNELVRESPYIAHNIEYTRRAYALHRITESPFAAEPGVEAVDVANNGETIKNIRLWDWRALRDTLRQIQAIRTYYDFFDIDIDRYRIDGVVRQVMLAVRELNIERLPESSRNWINEKLVYTHGYGITMNTVNDFTPDGLPHLVLKDMPVQSTIPEISVTRPEIYFGEQTNHDVYVRTRQQEFNYPQGEGSSLTSYEGTGGIPLGGFLRRLLIAFDRGDLTRLPFSDDVTSETRLLMRRNVLERVAALAPFLVFDPDPYVVLTAEGRLVWMLDGYTTSTTYPYARSYRLNRRRVSYMRNSVKATVDAYDGTARFYVFEPEDPVIAAYQRVFPSLFVDGAQLPSDLREHVRYPELMLELQAVAYGLYHVTDPPAFYNREDLWNVATEVSGNNPRDQPTLMEPNFVLIRLPGESTVEFVEMLPFTPANRNNLIGWIAGRSDAPHYGKVVAYHFPENRLVDGPLQVEARIDQDAQLSGQLSLWNQQGSSVRRGSLIVIPVGRALLYAEPIYLQADRSPMPQLRVVVLALQDRLAYGPTFEAALRGLFGDASPLGGRAVGQDSSPAAARAPAAPTQPGVAVPEERDTDELIREAAADLEAYQRLTAEGKLGEAGQRLEALKSKLERLSQRRR